jgi:hypothetical protein
MPRRGDQGSERLNREKALSAIEKGHDIAEAIAVHKETGSLCIRAGSNTLVVRTEHLKTFRDRVRLLSFGMASG